MLTKILLATAIPLGLPGFLSNANADFQYQTTSRVTGGALIQMMRFVPGGGGLKEPQISTVAVQGNHMVRRSKRQAEIIDLDKRTITTIDFEKHTYVEVTFDQMKQALAQMSAQISTQTSNAAPQQQNVNLDVDADIRNTGETKMINGMDTHQVVLTMSMGATDPQSGQSGTMKMNSEMWLAKDIPGAGEMRDFYEKMAKELDWAPTGMGAMMNRPDIARAMSKMMAAGGKLNGTVVQQVIRISGAASGVPADQQSAQQTDAAPPAKPSVSDAIGNALGSRLGGLGGFGKKKQDASGSPSTSTAATSGLLMETTVDSSGFSTSGVDASLFAIPADFKKVDQATPGARRK